MKYSIIPTKKQLRLELATIENLMSRYGYEITLIQAHDNVAVALDLYRGVGEWCKRKTNTEIIE